MRRRINNFLENYLHIRLTRVGRPLSLHSSNREKGKNLIVEFIGPSCIGKSTLYYHHLAHHRLHNGLSVVHGRKFRKNWSRYKKLDEPHFNKFHKQLLADRFKYNANRSVSGIQKFKNLRHFNLLLEIDAWIETHLTNHIIIFDEHLFGRLHHQQPKEKYFNPFLANRCIVNCYTPSEFHFDNIMKRKKAGTKPAVYEGLSKEGVYTKIKATQTLTESSISYFKERDVPILNLNIADGLDQNCQLLDNFITELSASFLNITKEDHV